jgi:oligo-1,6-glucosidase
MHPSFNKKSVVYQIYIKSFKDSDNDGIGDLKGILSKLDYLKELGVDVLWITPFYQSPNHDGGYDISDYQSIGQEYGTMQDFDELLKAAHDRGLKIILDLVINHTSSQHAWFIESSSTLDNPKRDYYFWRDGKDHKEPNNWGALFGGPAWTLDPKTEQYYLHLFSPSQPDLNWDNEKLRNEIYAMMTWWLDKGINGFRMDVISLISKTPGLPDGEVGPQGYGNSRQWVTNGPKVHEVLKEMRQKVLGHYDILTVGEASGATIQEAKKYASLDQAELDMIFQFEHMDLDGGETFKWNDQKIDLIQLKQCLSKWQIELHGQAWNSLYWCNHDQPRIVSRLGDEGDFREVSAKMLATCIHMMQGTPYIYQGEELAMTNVHFTDRSELRDLESLDAYDRYTQEGRFTQEEMLRLISLKARDNARTPMQWSEEPNGGFTQGQPWMNPNPNFKTINAQEQRYRTDSVFSYYKQLIALRKNLDIITDGNYKLLDENDPSVFSFIRTFKDEILWVICNFTHHEVVYHRPDVIQEKRSKILIRNVESDSHTKDTLRPYEAIVGIQWSDLKRGNHD